MVEVEDIAVTTAVSENEQALTVQADIGEDSLENLHYLRPLGANTWFTLIGTGRADEPIDRDEDGVPQYIHDIEQQLVDQGYPIRPLQAGSDYPDPGSVHVITGSYFEKYPLFSDPSTVKISKADASDNDEPGDARIQVTYDSHPTDNFEYDIYVTEGDLPQTVVESTGQNRNRY